MHVGVIDESSFERIVGDVCELIAEIRIISNPMFVESRLPDFTSKLVSHRVRKGPRISFPVAAAGAEAPAYRSPSSLG